MFRRTYVVLILFVCCAGSSAIFLGCAVIYPIGQKVWLGPLGAAAGWCAIRAWRCGIFVREWGLEVRDLFRTSSAQWGNITGFELINANPMNSRAVYVGIRLDDGRMLKSEVVCGSINGNYCGRVEQKLAALWRRATAAPESVLLTRPQVPAGEYWCAHLDCAMYRVRVDTAFCTGCHRPTTG